MAGRDLGLKYCTTKGENWATLKISVLLVPSNSTGNPNKVQAHGWTWQMWSDRNVITTEKDTYLGQPGYQIPPEVLMKTKNAICSQFHLHIDVRRDGRYLALTYRILLHHCAAAL